MPHFQNLLRRMRVEFRKKYCLHPDAPKACSTRIISAHSVQKAMLEKYIAVDGHVMQYSVELLPDPAMGLWVRPRRRGINQATTFYGFCHKHDSDLFRPLEISNFAFEPEQIALLGYRSICRDAYQKDAAIAAMDSARFYVTMHPEIGDFAEKDRVYQIKRLAMVNARNNFSRARSVFMEMITKRNFGTCASLEYNLTLRRCTWRPQCFCLNGISAVVNFKTLTHSTISTRSAFPLGQLTAFPPWFSAGTSRLIRSAGRSLTRFVRHGPADKPTGF
jgi:hypothetical protein